MNPFSASCLLDVVSRHYYPPPFSVLQQPFSTRSIFMSARRKECKIPNTFPKYYFQQTVNCDGLFQQIICRKQIFQRWLPSFLWVLILHFFSAQTFFWDRPQDAKITIFFLCKSWCRGFAIESVKKERKVWRKVTNWCDSWNDRKRENSVRFV